MSRHWQPDRRGKWLSPQAYEALSPAERQALWRERKLAGPHRRRSRKPGISGLVVTLMLVAFAVSWNFAPTTWPARPTVSALPSASGASGASEVRGDFHFCHSGGGTNCVVDGDTIWLEGQNIRIAGIDAPETHDYACAEEKTLGDRTTQRLLELVNSGAVTLSSIERDEDRYGRKLRNVAVDGRDVGETLVSEGLAREYGGGRRSWCG